MARVLPIVLHTLAAVHRYRRPHLHMGDANEKYQDLCSLCESHQQVLIDLTSTSELRYTAEEWSENPRSVPALKERSWTALDKIGSDRSIPVSSVLYCLEGNADALHIENQQSSQLYQTILHGSSQIIFAMLHFMMCDKVL